MWSLQLNSNFCCFCTGLREGREEPHHGSDGIGELHGLQLAHAKGGRAAHHLRVLLQQRLQVPAGQRLRAAALTLTTPRQSARFQ